jgi:hypothetical protein
MPFLTFQKVKSHRALRQAIRVVEEIRTLNEPIPQETMTSRKDARLKILIKELTTGLSLLRADDDEIKSLGLIKSSCMTKLIGFDLRDHSHTEMKRRTEPLKGVLEELRNTEAFQTPESIEWMERFQDAIEIYEQTDSSLGQEYLNSAQFKYESLLLQYYTKPEDPKGPHISRTLDQYYYSALPNTTYRDMDQVVRRYQAKRSCKVRKKVESTATGTKNKKKPKRKGLPKRKLEEFKYHEEDPETKIGMVDQLWLWIIDDSKDWVTESGYSANRTTFLETVITCFPQSSGPDGESSQPDSSAEKPG